MAPGHEGGDGFVVGTSGVWVAYVGGEELHEAQLAFLPGFLDEGGQGGWLNDLDELVLWSVHGLPL